MSEVKTLEWEKAISEGITGASGKVYKYCSELSVERYWKSVEVQAQMVYGTNTIDEITEVAVKAYNEMNTMKFADASVTLKNLIDRTNDIHSRFSPAVLLCAIYWNATDEDPMKYNEAVIHDKMNDWREYGVEGFFLLALKQLNSSAMNLERLTQSILEAQGMTVGEVVQPVKKESQK